VPTGRERAGRGAGGGPGCARRAACATPGRVHSPPPNAIGIASEGIPCWRSVRIRFRLLPTATVARCRVTWKSRGREPNLVERRDMRGAGSGVDRAGWGGGMARATEFLQQRGSRTVLRRSPSPREGRAPSSPTPFRVARPRFRPQKPPTRTRSGRRNRESGGRVLFALPRFDAGRDRAPRQTERSPCPRRHGAHGISPREEGPEGRAPGEPSEWGGPAGRSRTRGQGSRVSGPAAL